MLTVQNLVDVQTLIQKRFGEIRAAVEDVPLEQALDRVLAADLTAKETVPNFTRSTVDGYAVKGSDIFGCSDAIPAVLKLVGESVMGEPANILLEAGQCVSVPTGGEVPQGADAVVMLEDVEVYGDGTVGVRKPCALGNNLIFKGDDVQPGYEIYSKGMKIKAKDIGSLAALGMTQVPVRRSPKIAIISSGDELVEAGEVLQVGQIRDVNGPMLKAFAVQCGAQPVFMGIVRDDKNAVEEAIREAIHDCDILVLSGGTSAGVKDAIPDAVLDLGELLVHGIAVKPGKPTVVGVIQNKPIFGLPGNPVAAYFMFLLLVKPLIASMLGMNCFEQKRIFPIARAISSNQGREELVPVVIKDGSAHPISGKSGLITTLSAADGYFHIARDREGLKKGDPVEVILFGEETCRSHI